MTDQTREAVERRLRERLSGFPCHGAADKAVTYWMTGEEIAETIAETLAALSEAEERAIKAEDALQDLSIEDGHARREALALATWLHRTYYAEVKDWKPFTAASSLLTQIDNMVAGVRDRLTTAEAERDTALARIAGMEAGEPVATCDGIEQGAFEAWAKARRFDMTEHPLHYLFLDAKTDAARQDWKAGLEHAVSRATPAAALARAERAEAALRNIKIEYEREGSKMHHLQRVVAIQCREGLALSPAPTVKGEGDV